jgi:hypothetical protein
MTMTTTKADSSVASSARKRTTNGQKKEPGNARLFCFLRRLSFYISSPMFHM